MQPLEGTDVALSNTTHTLKLYGKTTGVTMKIDARSEEEGVAALVVGSVA